MSPPDAVPRAAGSGSARETVRVAMLLAVPLGFLAVFFAYPVAAIITTGLARGGGWTLAPVAAVFTDPGLRGVAWFTVWQAAASTGLTLLLALPGAYVLARYDLPGRRVVTALVTVPFVLPTVVVGSAFLGLVGPRGPLGLDLHDTVWSILLAHVFFNYAVVVRTVGGLLRALHPRYEEAARVLGASRWQALRSVVLPLLAPALAGAATIVFLFTFTSFGVVQILGGPEHATLEVEIYRQTAFLFDLPVAAVLALLQLAAVGALLVAANRLERRLAVEQRLLAGGVRPRRPTGAGGWALVAANLLVMGALLLTPLAVLVERSLATADGYGLSHYAALSTSRRGSILFVAPLEAVRNSLVFAGAATALALVVGGLASAALARAGRAGRRGRLAGSVDALLMLPLGTSAVTVGFGFVVALGTPPLDLRSSPALVPIAQALVAVPFVVRIVLPVLRAVEERLREAAAMLGASPWQVWREIDLPMMGRALAVAAGFAFAVSLGEFGATLFIARTDTPTVPVAIFRFLSQPGSANFGQAMALSTILMLLTATSVLLIERLRPGGRSAGVGAF